MKNLASLPTGALFAIGALVVVQLTLQIAAVVQLVKTPKERVSLNGNKAIWAIIIVAGEMVGAIVWFFAGRKPQAAEDPIAAASKTPDAVQTAVDSLYGPDSGADR